MSRWMKQHQERLDNLYVKIQDLLNADHKDEETYVQFFEKWEKYQSLFDKKSVVATAMIQASKRDVKPKKDKQEQKSSK